MNLYGLKTCDTCRKALKALVGQDVAYVDVRKDGVPMDVLTAAFAQFGEGLVNKKSTTWRGLTDAEKEGDPMESLRAHPALMKRPLIVTGSDMTLGWGKDVQAIYSAN